MPYRRPVVAPISGSIDRPAAICKYRSFMSSRLEPATRHYDEKLQHILKTSAKIFAEKGFHRTSVRDIARATKMSLAGLYYYFTTK
jgi:AcrR family transcriptional regulator